MESNEQTAQKLRSQKRDAKVAFIYSRIQAEVKELHLLVSNLSKKTYFNQKKKRFVSTKEEPILTLRKKVDDGPLIEPYLEIQACVELKKQTMAKCIQNMKDKFSTITKSIEESNKTLSNILPYAYSLQLKLLHQTDKADELYISLYNPLLYSKTEAKLYLIPVKDFEKRCEELSSNSKLFFEIVDNTSNLRKVVIPCDEIFWLKRDSLPKKYAALGKHNYINLIKVLNFRAFLYLFRIYGERYDESSFVLFRFDDFYQISLTTKGQKTKYSKEEQSLCVNILLTPD